MKKKENNINYNLNISNVDLVSLKKNNIYCNKKKSDSKIKLTTLMREFANANRRKEMPKHTNILCWWCCHSFETPPISIPKFYIDDTFYVFGCFCNFSCAAAYIFDSINISETNKWKYYSLLHILKNKMIKNNDKETIILSPPKESLKVFGGYMTIEELRNIKNNQIYNIIQPPIISIHLSIEESNIKNNTYKKNIKKITHAKGYNENKYNNLSNWKKNKNIIPINKNRIKKAEENIKLRRKIPLLDKRKTLLRYMNITINKKNK